MNRNDLPPQRNFPMVLGSHLLTHKAYCKYVSEVLNTKHKFQAVMPMPQFTDYLGYFKSVYLTLKRFCPGCR